MPSSYNPGLGGSNSGNGDSGFVPQVPSWTWAAGGGAPAAGRFTTNDAHPNTTTQIKLSSSVASLTPFTASPQQYFLIIVDASGNVSGFVASQAIDDGSGNPQLSLSSGFGSNIAWSGTYTMSVLSVVSTVNGIVKNDGSGTLSAAVAGTDYLTPTGSGAGLTGIVGVMTDDTGWTANADAGDKTQVIPSSATISSVQAALNIAVAGAGDALFATAQKVKALELALNINLLPSA